MKITIIQSSKWKKSSGRLLATNWRNLVTRCKFLVASLYNVNDTNHSIRACFRYLARSRSHEININPQNITKFARNLIIETCLGYWELFNCCKLANLSWNFITTMSEQHPKTTTSHDVKSFAIGSFLEHFVVKTANDYFC